MAGAVGPALELINTALQTGSSTGAMVHAEISNEADRQKVIERDLALLQFTASREQTNRGLDQNERMNRTDRRIGIAKAVMGATEIGNRTASNVVQFAQYRDQGTAASLQEMGRSALDSVVETNLAEMALGMGIGSADNAQHQMDRFQAQHMTPSVTGLFARVAELGPAHDEYVAKINKLSEEEREELARQPTYTPGYMSYFINTTEVTITLESRQNCRDEPVSVSKVCDPGQTVTFGDDLCAPFSSLWFFLTVEGQDFELRMPHHRFEKIMVIEMRMLENVRFVENRQHVFARKALSLFDRQSQSRVSKRRLF